MDLRRFLAVDLGAESGRVVVGNLQDGRLTTEEIHRFPNEPARVRGTLYWDVLNLYNNILAGMRQYVREYGTEAEALGIDTWAVDFGLLARDGSLLQNPVCYRDSRTDGMPDYVRRRMPEADLYGRTGIYMLPIYTLCQMVSLRAAESPVLECADGWLMMPDLLAYFLTGRRGCERTNAITTQLYDPRRGCWHEEVFETFDLPLDIMPDFVEPGTELGPLTQSVRDETGLGPVPVVAPCTHDTGSAVAAVPGQGHDWAFLSCGTWSILGSLCEEVATGKEALEAGLCNELTLDSFFLCQNIMGLWLLQQSRTSWVAAGDDYSYPELVEMARKAPRAEAMLDPNDDGFMAPDDMPTAIVDYCRRTGQAAPQGPADLTRCILESLAFSYRYALERIGRILGRSYRTLHIVGGGSLNTLLCELTAGVTGLQVVAGPVEATVAGNILVQAYGRGLVESPQQIRDIVRASFEPVHYEPAETDYWQERYEQYCEMLTRKT